MNNYHIPVLLQEVLTNLAIQPGEQYIDCTLGGGGHTFAMLAKGARVLGIDADQDAIDYVSENRKEEDLMLVRGNFKDITTIAHEAHFKSVAGILMDLGVSSHQLDTPSRGFSFQDGPLDMRMDPTLSVTAKDLINGLTEKELVNLFEKFGEEHAARKIARGIVQQRKQSPIQTTHELAELVRRSSFGGQAIHPATRVFQALRIAVNDELFVLEETLPKAFGLLKPGGKLVVISFHSLEDRIVKKTFELLASKGEGKIITDKPIQATDEEVLQNKRARSAKLRTIERI